MSECRIDVHYRDRLMDLEETMQEAACENECLRYELMTAKAKNGKPEGRYGEAEDRVLLDIPGT